MELRQIRSFLSIAETLHFGRTAEMLPIGVDFGGCDFFSKV
jgi:DNA-binding transcriptional LysR family regulator